MADIPSNIPGAPQGAEPMKKSTGKVQPKKETVRINLPPKPSAAPTIKLPTLPPGGGGTGVPSMAPSAAPAAPAAAPRASAAAPSIQRQATAPQAAPRPTAPVATAPARAAVMSPLDKGLAIAAGICGLIGVGTTVYLAFLFKDNV
ncbi:MAG TPA: hypothetical protein VH597_01590 [Verrucomicrobiae bacterium]|nr:hypothetical protein [Verrucomicrobiae bacterium]